VDAKLKEDSSSSWEVVTYGGRNRTGIDVLEWTEKVADSGAGEILLTSMDRDGTKEGFDNKLVFGVSSSIDIPVIASGGVGNLQHLIDGIREGGAEAVLAASIFHFSEFTIQEAKEAMKASGIVVRS
jgi:cyclase